MRAVLSLEMPEDRLPAIEWASWWNETLRAWRAQGLPEELSFLEIAPYLGLDQHVQFWLPHRAPDCPEPPYHGGPRAEDEAGYEALLPYLYAQEGAGCARLGEATGAFLTSAPLLP